MTKQTEWIYGLHAVKELLKSNAKKARQLFVLKGREDAKIQEIMQLARESHVKHQILSRGEFDQKFSNANHQGVAAMCDQHSVELSEAELIAYAENNSSVLLLILDGVQDPHNLGACLRSANAMGVYAVVTPKDKSASVTETVKKVACGAAEHTPVVAVGNLNRFLDGLKAAGVWLVGLDAEGGDYLSAADLKGRIAIVMGSEGSGLRRLTKEACDYLVKIPMLGVVESLNVSVATGIALYEVIRQRNSFA